MELRQLEYFVAVARHRHFGRAAEAVYVTQPALSQQVQRLEAELGVALLRRTSRGVELTPAGEDLLGRAEAILAGVAQARGAMDEHAGVVRGAVRVAATSADALRLPEVLAGFHRDHPGVRLALRHASAAEVLNLLRRAAVDLAVMSLSPGDETAGLQVTPLGEEPLRAIAAPDEPFRAVVVALGDLQGRPFVLPEPATALRATVMDACQAQGFSPVPLLEVGDPATVRYMAHAGLGASVVPVSWLDGPGPAVAVARLADPAPRYRLSLLVPAAGLSPAGRLLHEQLRIAFGAGSDDGG
jgi:DNA-binding transcriptional LysR family regulator